MKRLLYAAILVGFLGIAKPAEAQVSVSINIGAQPLWGPVGYDYVRYYYMPEIDVYYDVSHRRYTYYHGNRWITRSSLPNRYRHVDMYRTYKVVLNHDHPWRNHRHVRRQYSRYAHNHSQRIIRDHRRHDHYERHNRDRRHEYKRHHKNHDRGHRGHHRRHDD
ncbi:hypothetical protein [Sphingobacterium suaedae]|uniref:DUF3300 domain-containing protein n=1 Tax=Sphingobacterium suaedae TaxID=1686402 RepID=A0ABW5KD22_9SPHI